MFCLLRSFLYIPEASLFIYKNARMFLMSDPTAYTLKVPSKLIQRITIATLLLFLATLPVMDIPMSDASFPAHITEAARIVSLGSLIVTMLSVLVFTFYRNRVIVYVDDTGIQLPDYDFISWKSIRWYRVNVFSSNGIRGVTLKVGSNKVVIGAENDEALFTLIEDIKQRLRVHNPLAKDFMELKSSKRKAYIIISIMTAIHLTVTILIGFDEKYLVIFTLVLLVSIGAVLMEHIKIT